MKNCLFYYKNVLSADKESLSRNSYILTVVRKCWYPYIDTSPNYLFYLQVNPPISTSLLTFYKKAVFLVTRVLTFESPTRIGHFMSPL